MTDKNKIEILKHKIELLEKENETLRRKITEFPDLAQLVSELTMAKTEYESLCKELIIKKNEYQEIIKDVLELKNKYKKEMVNGVKNIKKVGRR